MLQARSWLPRTEGSIRLAFEKRDGATALAALRQTGAARVRFPRPGAGEACEAVLLNTAGGLTGGDSIEISVALGAGAQVTVTTAAAEKFYRAQEGEARIGVKLDLAENARLAWLPQPTIMFDRARLDRRTEVALAENATFLAVETVIFGRTAMGEDVYQGACRDVRRIRRAGRLVFADTLHLEGGIAAILDRPATLDQARAVAAVVYVGPDAPARLDEVRAALTGAKSEAGASTWNGVLSVRAAAPAGQVLQEDLKPVIELLSGRPLPRLWHT